MNIEALRETISTKISNLTEEIQTLKQKKMDTGVRSEELTIHVDTLIAEAKVELLEEVLGLVTPYVPEKELRDFQLPNMFPKPNKLQMDGWLNRHTDPLPHSKSCPIRILTKQSNHLDELVGNWVPRNQNDGLLGRFHPDNNTEYFAWDSNDSDFVYYQLIEDK